MSKLILASESQYRARQLSQLSLKFGIVPSKIDESPLIYETPAELAMRLAVAKACEISRAYVNATVIGCDQVCAFKGQILGKPGNQEKAIEQLQTFSNQSVQFYTAVCVIDADGKQHQHTDLTTVNFRQLNAEEILRYLEKEQPFNCSGSFKVESLGLSLFESVESKDLSALMGLPLIKLCEYLRLCGYEVP